MPMNDARMYVQNKKAWVLLLQIEQFVVFVVVRFLVHFPTLIFMPPHFPQCFTSSIVKSWPSENWTCFLLSARFLAVSVTILPPMSVIVSVADSRGRLRAGESASIFSSSDMRKISESSSTFSSKLWLLYSASRDCLFRLRPTDPDAVIFNNSSYSPSETDISLLVLAIAYEQRNFRKKCLSRRPKHTTNCLTSIAN